MPKKSNNKNIAEAAKSNVSSLTASVEPKGGKRTNGVAFYPETYERLRIIAEAKRRREGGRASISKIIEDLVATNIDALEKEYGL